MRRGWGLALIVIAGCGGAPAAGGATEPGAPEPASGPIVASEGALNAPPPSAATGGESTPEPAAAEGAEILAVAPGFRPDPIVRRGPGGGPVSAEAIHPDCRGYITAEPSYLLKVDAAMTLRLLVHMQGDATLVVQLADGRVMCNDDSEGLDPIVEGAFPPGRHRVFVGTYGEHGVGTAYTFAVTTQATLTTQALDGLAITP